MISLLTLQQTNTQCKKCELRAGCNNVVPGDGPDSATIMVVGEAPGEDEDLESLPFVGRSGKLLNRMLNEAGLVRSNMYITNLVKCRPPKNRKPLPNEIKSCKIWLWEEMQALRNLKVIVTLGSTASGTLLKIKNIKMKDFIGKPISVEYTSAVIMPWYHPSYLLRHNNVALNNQTIEFFTKVKEKSNYVR